ncbi:MAG: DMT family transporter [Chloroflexota bacterium]
MTNVVNKTMGAMEWGLLIGLSLLWGGSFFFVEVALVDLRPFTLVFLRVLLAAIALNIVVVMIGNRMPTSGKLWGSFLMMGLLNNLIPFSLIVWGQKEITGGLAAILNATAPLWTVILAHFFTSDEKLTPAKIVGVILGLFGVVLIIGPEALAGLGGNLLAQTAVLVAAVSYAFAGLYGKRFKGIPPIVTATGQISGTTVMMLPLVLIVDQPWTMSAPSLSTWGALLGLALLSTTVAYIIYFQLLSTAGATNLLLVTFLIPISAFVLGWLFLDEVLALLHVIGMGLIGLGLVAIDGRLLKRFQP